MGLGLVGSFFFFVYAMSSQCFTCRQKRKLSETELSERIPFGVSEQLTIADQVCIYFYLRYKYNAVLCMPRN